jgi:hypothetical protein
VAENSQAQPSVHFVIWKHTNEVIERMEALSTELDRAVPQFLANQPRRQAP